MLGSRTDIESNHLRAHGTARLTNGPGTTSYRPRLELGKGLMPTYALMPGACPCVGGDIQVIIFVSEVRSRNGMVNRVIGDDPRLHAGFGWFRYNGVVVQGGCE